MPEREKSDIKEHNRTLEETETAPEGTPPSKHEPEENETEAPVDVQTGQSEGGPDAQVVEQPEPTEEERLRSQAAELEDKLLRTAAEFDNYRKRMARQIDETIQAANDRLLTELLEVVDSLERALNQGNDDARVESYHKGTELIFGQMMSLLKKYEVTPIESIGQPFDPNLHEALMQVESDEYPEGTVAVEMAKGYRIGNRVLRHARVGVSKGKPSSKPEGNGEQPAED
ncbi:MAG: nucleotide exchange factor GrpE [Candidatus Zixiibacteriota bacterium]